MKLFGLAIYSNNWPAFCFGKKAKEKWFLSIYDPDEVYRVWEK